MLEYKGYVGHAVYDADSHSFHGEVLDTSDVITFQSDTESGLERAFRDSIDDYLEFCVVMNDKRAMLRHFLAALAYRTQKALRGAPESFGAFQAGNQVRTPAELVRHMTSVLGYARTFFEGGRYWPEPLPDLGAEVNRFHDMIEDLSRHLVAGTALKGTTEERLLQGPFSDAMTHAGQLAMLRRLSGSPVPPENFVVAAVDPDNLGPDQPEPVSPDAVWPEAPR